MTRIINAIAIKKRYFIEIFQNFLGVVCNNRGGLIGDVALSQKSGEISPESMVLLSNGDEL
ncbi:MAG: hypothetical protein JNL01_16215 [Bdellovibrionales bacterium]|nr:hypothetical protein [Bdellovibrionales bacterium]